MKKGYKILCLKNTHLGFIVEVLNKDSTWNIASSNCLFKTLAEAQVFFKKTNCELRGSNIYIEGPKGGRYRLFA
jgi:hypothetical protein